MSRGCLSNPHPGCASTRDPSSECIIPRPVLEAAKHDEPLACEFRRKTPLMNHLWQSTLFVLVAAIAAVALRKSGAHIRYRRVADCVAEVPGAVLFVSVGSALPRSRAGGGRHRGCDDGSWSPLTFSPKRICSHRSTLMNGAGQSAAILGRVSFKRPLIHLRSKPLHNRCTNPMHFF